MEYILAHLPELVLGAMGVLKIIVNLTPSEKDNKIFDWLDKLIDVIVPNLKKNGGKH